MILLLGSVEHGHGSCSNPVLSGVLPPSLPPPCALPSPLRPAPSPPHRELIPFACTAVLSHSSRPIQRTHFKCEFRGVVFTGPCGHHHVCIRAPSSPRATPHRQELLPVAPGGPPATATKNLLSVRRWASSGRGRWCSVSGVLHRARGFWTRPCGHAASLLWPRSLSALRGWPTFQP